MTDRKPEDERASQPCGFLRRLVKDTRANTIAIMAAALIPLAGMVGGGIDISRMYILKTRLQHACDSGALAGRKTMGGGSWSQNSGAPGIKALQYFDANFQSGSYGSYSLTRSFTENAGKVTGTVSAMIPMTLMKIFYRGDETINVTCQSEMRLPNTDVMFVLDNTGSMDDTPSGDSMKKIDSLKIAVKCFYEIVAKLDTDANCTTGVPSGGTSNAVQIRFGFMPYSTNVNVGKLLPTSYFADNWSYQSREPEWTTQNVTNWVQVGLASTSTNTVNVTGVQSWNCYVGSWALGAYDDTEVNYSNNNSHKQTRVNSYTIVQWTSSSGGTCRILQTTVQTEFNSETTQQQVFNRWHYGLISHNIAGLKNGTSWNSSVSLPIGSSGTNTAVSWDGCIEERPTVSQASYSPIPAAAKDMDIDLVPTQVDASSLFGPALPDAIYQRQVTSSWSQRTTSDSYTTTNYYQGVNYYCPAEARKLQAWPSASAFDAYVDGLTPTGNTYHDVGLTWGARFMSPTGMFASENALTPQGGEIERHMIFMTDGDACSNENDYASHGLNWFDRRTTGSGSVPTGGCTTTGTITQQINARTEALCTAIKNKNITLWVVSFGSLDSTTVTRLTACASSGKYFTANNAAQLQATFKSIADQISQLRLTR